MQQVPKIFHMSIKIKLRVRLTCLYLVTFPYGCILLGLDGTSVHIVGSSKILWSNPTPYRLAVGRQDITAG